MEVTDQLQCLLDLASTTYDPTTETLIADQLLHHANATAPLPTTTPSSTQNTDDQTTRAKALHQKALSLYLSAARAGSTDAARKAALLLWKDGEKRVAESVMRDAVERGDMEACRMLADWLWKDAEESMNGRRSIGGGGGDGVDSELAREDAEEEEDDINDGSIDSDDSSSDNDTNPSNIPSIPVNTHPKHRTPATKDPRSKAFKLYLVAAKKHKDLPSIRRVAQCYASGQVVGKQNMRKAAKYWELAAERGDREAVATLAKYYQSVATEETSVPKAQSQDEASKHNAKQQSEKDTTDLTDEDTPNSKLLRYTSLAASDGDAASLRHLADAHLNGTHSIPKNASTALTLYLKAATAGDISSLSCAAHLLHTGADGIPPDRHRAFDLYELSAKQGWTPSYRCLAECYRTGVGAPGDKPDAAMAFRCYESAAWEGDVGSLKLLGDCYWDGVGVEKDCAVAVEWYERAAERGDGEAVRCLARCYWLGIGVEWVGGKAKELMKRVVMGGEEGFGGTVDFDAEGVEDRFEQVMDEVL
ncbi:hypothetical protein HDV00_007151 [Rhizophlyctis rosea]|nr:hypothetical protein HDV00_007151 [Rhizophlyctis rosea]